MALEEFVRGRNLGDFSYFLANENCFFFRFADSGFKNKWTGFWKQETKFLEYFALKAGRNWLSPEACKSVRYNFALAEHVYAVGGGKIRETIFIPEGADALAVKLDSGEKMEFELELAANIRRRTENKNARKYTVEKSGKSIRISNELGALSLDVLAGEINFRPGAVCKTHAPSGEEQDCFIPGKIILRGRKIIFAISALLDDERAKRIDYVKSLAEKQARYERLAGGIKSDNRGLVRAFRCAALATELLRKKSGGTICYYAGLPWFQQCWARDTFWVLPSLLGLGCFQEAKSCLRKFAAGTDGRIPNFISETEGTAMNALDATLLWIISLDYYAKHSGDAGFLESMQSRLELALDFLCSRDKDGDGFLEHDTDSPETWMDTLKRNSRAVDIQALYFRALKAAREMFMVLGLANSGRTKDIERRTAMLEKRFDNKFFAGFYLDRVPAQQSTGRTANALVALLCGFRRHEKRILGTIESVAFTTPAGVRSMALGQGFENGYHTGMVWSLTTAWACAAEFAAGRPDAGWGYFKTLAHDMERDALGAVGECWDSFSLAQTGCGLQLWGSAFIPRLVDEFMLGIKVDALNSCVHVNPCLPSGVGYVERELLMGKEKVRLKIEKARGKTTVSCGNSRIKIIS